MPRSHFPILSCDSTWNPSPRFLGEKLGFGISDSDVIGPNFVIRNHLQPTIASSDGFEVVKDKDKFKVWINAKHFRPQELNITMQDKTVVIKGKHEERSDEHGFVSREFTRKYSLPEGVELGTVSSSMSLDGVLTIEAPWKAAEPIVPNERVVPIKME